MMVERVTTLVLVLALAAVGCDNKGEGSGAAASAKATATAAGKAAPALRDASGKLTKAGVDAAWKEVFMGTAAAHEPAEKKIAAFEAKVGKPAKEEGGKKIWLAVDGADCYQIELGKDGTKGAEKVPAAKCGG